MRTRSDRLRQSHVPWGMCHTVVLHQSGGRGSVFDGVCEDVGKQSVMGQYSTVSGFQWCWVIEIGCVSHYVVVHEYW